MQSFLSTTCVLLDCCILAIKIYVEKKKKRDSFFIFKGKTCIQIRVDYNAKLESEGDSNYGPVFHYLI